MKHTEYFGDLCFSADINFKLYLFPYLFKPSLPVLTDQYTDGQDHGKNCQYTVQPVKRIRIEWLENWQKIQVS
jgi:hypothetical protein